MVNNFELIGGMLDFSNPDTYYFLQVLKRRKDNPTMEKDMMVIDDYFIYSSRQYDKMRNDVIATCQAHNARAYFRLNKRSIKKSAFQTLKRVTDLIVSENYKDVKSVYSSISGEFCSDEDKTWIVDIDDVTIDGFNHSEEQISVRRFLSELQEEAGRTPMLTFIPTKSGVHIITRPFNLKKFKDRYPDIDVHKDNPTILYVPLNTSFQ